MTGRDLIIYILENKLEDSEAFNNGSFLNFMDVDTAAAKYDVGRNTVLAWIQIGVVSAIKLGDTYYIYPEGQNVIKRALDETEVMDNELKAFLKAHYPSWILY